MKRWCNNVDWSLESVLLNINNDGGDSKRFGLGTHSLNILKRDISYFRNGRVPFKMGVISYLEIIISLEMTLIIDLAKTVISTPFIGAKLRYFSARST